MDSDLLPRLDAANFRSLWQRFDVDDNGYIEGKELDNFFCHLLEILGSKSTITEEKVQRMKEQLMSTYNVTNDGRLQIQELANMILTEEDNFLLLFQRETPLNNSVEFMRIWRHYDADSSGFISAGELRDFLQDLFQQHGKNVSEAKLKEYTDTMVPGLRTKIINTQREEVLSIFYYISIPETEHIFQPLMTELTKLSKPQGEERTCNELVKASIENRVVIRHLNKSSFVKRGQMKLFDKNKDGRLDLNDLARILALQENFLLQFKLDASSGEERKRDFDKIFAHYDVSKTGALEGPEVDGFVKDMMELVKPSISGTDLDKFREILLHHCDVNKDGKIQKSELALCLGIKNTP